jgi:hypothetical protein
MKINHPSEQISDSPQLHSLVGAIRSSHRDFLIFVTKITNNSDCKTDGICIHVFILFLPFGGFGFEVICYVQMGVSSLQTGYQILNRLIVVDTCSYPLLGFPASWIAAKCWGGNRLSSYLDAIWKGKKFVVSAKGSLVIWVAFQRIKVQGYKRTNCGGCFR